MLVNFRSECPFSHPLSCTISIAFSPRNRTFLTKTQWRGGRRIGKCQTPLGNDRPKRGNLRNSQTFSVHPDTEILIWKIFCHLDSNRQNLPVKFDPMKSKNFYILLFQLSYQGNLNFYFNKISTLSFYLDFYSRTTQI